MILVHKPKNLNLQRRDYVDRKKIATKEDLMTAINLLENANITYWIDGGWGVDILAEVLSNIEDFTWSDALYLPIDKNLGQGHRRCRIRP